MTKQKFPLDCLSGDRRNIYLFTELPIHLSHITLLLLVFKKKSSETTLLCLSSSL